MVEVKCGTVFIDFFELKTNLRAYPLAVVSLVCRTSILLLKSFSTSRLMLRDFS